LGDPHRAEEHLGRHTRGPARNIADYLCEYAEQGRGERDTECESVRVERGGILQDVCDASPGPRANRNLNLNIEWLHPYGPRMKIRESVA